MTTRRQRINLDALPYPIAMSYRRIGACHGKDARRLKNILQTAEMAARFIAVVILSDLRERVKANAAPPPATLQKPVENLRRPSFGHWIEIIREGMLASAESDHFFIPELRHFVFAQKIGSPAEPFKKLNDIVATRNRFAHGDMSPADIGRACDETEDSVKDILSVLSFLDAYPPFYVRRINVRKRRLDPLRFTHQFWLLSGPYPEPEAISDERDRHTDTDELILHRDEDGEFINLYPLLVYMDSEHYDETSGIRPDLYVINGYDKKKDRLDLHYLPCGGSGQPFKTSDLPDEAEWVALEKGAKEYLELFCTGREPG